MKRNEARESLPDELRADFDQLVADYQFTAQVRHGARFAAFAVLADLVRLGWRKSGTDTYNPQSAKSR